MTTVPKTFLGRLEFFEQRLPAWEEDPAAIGLLEADVAALRALTESARARYEELEAIRTAAEGATFLQKSANDAMFAAGMGLVGTVKAFARRTGERGVYPAAQVPAPKDPTPTGPPPAAKNLRVRLLPSGALRLAWEGTTARGAFFSIYRGLPGESAEGPGGMRLLATVAAKHYTDGTIPPGTPEVRYAVEARRAGHGVGGAVLVVPFGSGETAAGDAVRAAGRAAA